MTLLCQITQNEGPAATHCHASPAASCRLRRQIFLEELRPRIWQHGIYRAAIPDLTSFSFRAPRFAQRWLVLQMRTSGSGKRSRGVLFVPRNLLFDRHGAQG